MESILLLSYEGKTVDWPENARLEDTFSNKTNYPQSNYNIIYVRQHVHLDPDRCEAGQHK